VGGSEDDPEGVRSEHHRDTRASERGEHLGVTRIVVPAGEQCGLVDRGGDDALDCPRCGERDRPLDRETGKPAGHRVAA
jgi:hypothetical protein